MKKQNKEVTITRPQKHFLEDLWFVWGNNGPKHSMDNHKFIQGILERGDYDTKFFSPAQPLVQAVDSILSSQVRRENNGRCEKCGKRTFNEVNVQGRWAFWCGCV